MSYGLERTSRGFFVALRWYQRWIAGSDGEVGCELPANGDFVLQTLKLRGDEASVVRTDRFVVVEE